MPRDETAHERMTAHELLCAERYSSILGRLSRLETVILGTTAALIMTLIGLVGILLERAVVWVH